MKKATLLLLALGVIASIGTGTLVAQTAVSADGVIESTSGGLKFPDGTLQATASAGNVALVPDTGQTGCWDTTGTSRPCAGTGEDGENQAGVAWPTPRFTDNGDGTVTDNLTTLTWLKDADCAAGTRTWQGALDWVVLLNTTSIACTNYTAMTFTDWRLPNIKELLSLVDHGESSPALPSDHLFSSVVSSVYCSSTTFSADASGAWFANLANGTVNVNSKDSLGYYFWPVRGGQ